MGGPPDYVTQRVSADKRYDTSARERSMMGVIKLVTRHIEFQQAIGIAVGPRLKSKLQTPNTLLDPVGGVPDKASCMP